MTYDRCLLSYMCHFQSVKKVINKLKGLLHIVRVWMYSNSWIINQSIYFT